jgi:hypothetical protein
VCYTCWDINPLIVMRQRKNYATLPISPRRRLVTNDSCDCNQLYCNVGMSMLGSGMRCMQSLHNDHWYREDSPSPCTKFSLHVHTRS